MKRFLSKLLAPAPLYARIAPDPQIKNPEMTATCKLLLDFLKLNAKYGFSLSDIAAPPTVATTQIANSTAPFSANSQCMRIIRRLLVGDEITNMHAIRMLNASSGGSRVRDVMAWLDGQGVPVTARWETNPHTNKRHKVWSLGYRQRAQVRRLLGMK